ncbi:MAG: MFS transporter [Pseudomonadota bacterium]
MNRGFLGLGICILAMTAIITSMFGFGRNVMVIMWPRLIDQFGMTYSDVGNLTAIHQGAYFLGSLAAGKAASMARPEIIISFSTIGGGALVAAVGFTDQYTALFLIYGALGLLIAFAWVPMVRYTALSMEKAQRVAALSIAACGTAIGFLINGVVIPPALAKFGVSSMWFGLGMVTMLIGLMSFIVLTWFAQPKNDLTESGIHSITADGTVPQGFPVLVFYAVLFLCGIGLVSFQTYFSAYLVEDLHFAESAAANAWIIPGILGAFSGVFLTYIANRFTIKVTIMLCLAVLGSAFMAMAIFQSAQVAAFVAILYGAFYFGLFGLFPAFLANTVSERSASLIFGRANLFLGVGSVAGGVAGGKFTHYFGSFGFFWLFTTGTIVIALLLMSRIHSDA